MYIEFVGLPGSGKTTLRKNLLLSLRKNGESRCISIVEAFLDVSKDRIDRIFRYPLRILPRSAALKLASKLINRSRSQFEAQNFFIARHGAALKAFLVSDVHRHMSELDKQRVIGNFLSMGALWQFTNTKSMHEKVVFFEEGLVQKSFMFVDHSRCDGRDKNKIMSYLDNIPRTNLVIYVSASIQTSCRRMRSRPDGLTDRLKHASDETIKSFLKASQAHLDIVTEWLTKNSPREFVVFDSEDRLPTEFDDILDRIKKLIP